MTIASTDSQLLNELGGLATMGLCVLVAWIGARLSCRPVDLVAGHDAEYSGHGPSSDA